MADEKRSHKVYIRTSQDTEGKKIQSTNTGKHKKYCRRARTQNKGVTLLSSSIHVRIMCRFHCSPKDDQRYTPSLVPLERPNY